MSVLARKHVNDILGFLVGADTFAFNPAAREGWAYPLDLEFTLRREDEHYSPKDEAGLPVRRYRSAGVQYNPTRIAAFALAHHNRYVQAGSEESRDLFLRAAAWFAGAEDGVWWYHFDWNDLRAPWASCMAQGEGISVLVRAFQETGDERFLRCARRALVPLQVPIASGGVRSTLEDGRPFLEEYPSPRPVHVLNGFLFALNGIHDLMRVDPGAGDAVGLEELLASLEVNLPRWDLGYWSAYDLAVGPGGRRNVTTVAYHRLHVAQLRYLGEVLDSAVLRETASRWRTCAASFPGRVRAMGGKLLYRSLVSTQR